MSRTGRITILIILVIIAAVGLTALIGSHNKKTTQNSSQAATTQTVTTVTYNGKGFVPAEITISAGTTISFVNNSATSMQVSSDNAGFNAGKSLGKGESYSFVFKAKGNFSYLNQLNKSQTGKITVL